VPIEACGWVPASGPLPPYAALDRDLDADVVVVGAGLTGATVALRLAQRGVSVVLLEAAQPADAASGRNAGHVLPYLGSLSPLERWPDQGARFLEYFVAHRRLVYDLCAEHGIDGDAERVG
jgi:glycine/D-amino acid oxidase-like deaminating enzyme